MAQSPTTRRVSKRIAQIAPSATLSIDEKAKALAAAGEPVISFGAGEPDFATPAHIVEAAAAACLERRNHGYTPTAGLPELRSAIVDKTLRDSGLSIAANQVLVTNGGKQAIFNAFATIIDEGDEVILPAPYWTTYPESIKLAGGVPVEVFAGADAGFKVTTDQLDAVVNDRTKAIVFVSPSNPSGAVYTKGEMREIGLWAASKGIWVLTDEIYEHLVYGGNEQSSIVAVTPELEDRWVVVNGVAKTYAMTGWRVGWMISAPDIISAANNLQSHATSNVSNVSQRAVIAGLTGPQDCVSEMREAFDERRQVIHKMFSEIDGVSCLEPGGAFYVFPSFEGVIGKTIRGTKIDSSSKLAEVLLEEAKVAVVPGEAFGAPGYARLSYALSQDAMVEGVTRIGKLLSEAT